MGTYVLTEEKIKEFAKYLEGEERGKATIQKYVRNIRFFAAWMGGRIVTKEKVAEWKASLQGDNFAPSTINSKLAALNSFFSLPIWRNAG